LGELTDDFGKATELQQAARLALHIVRIEGQHVLGTALGNQGIDMTAADILAPADRRVETAGAQAFIWPLRPISGLYQQPISSQSAPGR